MLIRYVAAFITTRIKSLWGRWAFFTISNCFCHHHSDRSGANATHKSCHSDQSRSERDGGAEEPAFPRKHQSALLFDLPLTDPRKQLAREDHEFIRAGDRRRS
jgi:hypothetical protein